MNVFIVEVVCDHPDTRVDAGAVIKQVVGVLKAKPTKATLAKILKKKMVDDDIEPSDRKLYWTQVTPSVLT